MNTIKTLLTALVATSMLFLSSCGDDDSDGPVGTGNSKVYVLSEFGDSGVSGVATFEEYTDGSTLIALELNGTPAGASHPAHIHMNTAAEGGGIALSLTPVDGDTGTSLTIATALDNGDPISFEDFLTYDGYINVHLSASDLATIVAQGDIGQNELTGTLKSYELEERDVDGISGSVTFAERLNGEALAIIELMNTPDGGSHPAHIHMNTAAEGGGIAFSFNPVNGTSGMSATNVSALDDGSAFGFNDVLDYDGYVNVHLSSSELGTIVAQGDIGQNELTGETKSYPLEERDVDGISGSVTFAERVNGEALATIQLMNTPNGGSHPAHIHMNTAAEGGGIAYTFVPVDGTSGMSRSNVAALDDGTAFGYDDVLAYDGYVNVHLSADALATIVAQGDIGQNELTGMTKSYPLEERDVDGISGMVTFAERVNGEALATIELMNTPNGGSHPAHIHMNTAAEGGGIAYTFVPVDGTSGISRSNVAALDDGTVFGYDDVLAFDGYVNVHLSANELATIVAQGDIGQNELTGVMEVYTLNEVDVAGVTGTAAFKERVNGETLVEIILQGTDFAGDHPSHIHVGSVAEAPGAIAVTLTSVNNMGISRTNVTMEDASTMLTYSNLIAYDGYINVHLSANDLATLVAQGNIGANAN